MSGIIDRILIRSSSSQGVSLDRTLGTVASITLTIGVYRVLSAAMKSNGCRMPSTGIANLICLLIGSGANKLMQCKEMESGILDNGVLVKLKGSCHCRSVSFVLKAPKTVIAKDCNGKIRYPHYITSAENFQLVSGTKYLSVYYVNLAQTERGHVVAAHTFCSRCGVHILRAPNSDTDKLEVNTNCLEDRSNVKEFKTVGGLNELSLGCGKALESRLRSHKATPNHGLHVVKDHDRDDDSSWMRDEEFIRSIEKREIPSKIYNSDTPRTSATASASTLVLPTDSEDASYSDVSSLHSARSRVSLHSSRSKYSQSYVPYHTRGSMSVTNADTMSISGWAVGSSLRSDSMGGHLKSQTTDDGISLSSMPFRDYQSARESRGALPSAVLKDKLKHYMRKHNSSSRRRTEAIAEENGL